MTKSNSKKLLIIIIIEIIVCGITLTSFATDSNPSGGFTFINNNTVSGNNVVEGNNTAQENNVALNNTVQTNNTVPQVNNTVAVNNSVSNYNRVNTATPSNNTNSTLPKTGENDIYIVSLLMVIFGVSAIYAYRKIREYNI